MLSSAARRAPHARPGSDRCGVAQWETSSNASVETTSTLRLSVPPTKRGRGESSDGVYHHDRCWACEPSISLRLDNATCAAMKYLGAMEAEIDEQDEKVCLGEVRAARECPRFRFLFSCAVLM